MFQYVYPQFEKKRLLRVEMLDQLRDYPKNLFDLSLHGFGNGIVNGCGFTWDNGVLTISPGIIYHNEKLYMLTEPFVMDCKAEDRMRYLKVQFLTEAREMGRIVGNTRIVLEDKKADGTTELELCRFRLQNGARLRSSYESFSDYSTEYDTINLIYQPYAAAGGCTLNPKLVRQFARELIKCGVSDPLDAGFSMAALSNNGVVSVSCMEEYLSARHGEDFNGNGNGAIYRGLLDILKDNGKGEFKRRTGNHGNRGMLLI